MESAALTFPQVDPHDFTDLRLDYATSESSLNV